MDQDKLFSKITDQMPGLIAVYNLQSGQYLYVNNALKKLLGYNPQEFLNGGLAFATSLVHPEDLPRVMEENNQAILDLKNSPTSGAPDPIISFEYRMKHKNGSWRWVYTEGSVFERNNNGDIELIINISVDITDRKNKEAQLEKLKSELEQNVTDRNTKLTESENKFRSLVQAVEDYAIFLLDTDGNITSWNEGIEHILGYTEPEILGKHISLFFSESDKATNQPEQELAQAAKVGSSQNEGVRIRKDGSTFYAMGTTTAIYDAQGKLTGFSKIMRDVTNLKEAEETIRFQALHDTLTGLANRKALDEHFTFSQSAAIRHQHRLAVLFLDLDRFKVINDTLGHTVGDMILKEVAHRLLNSVRKIDTVARLGGDEFIILLNEIHSDHDVSTVAEKILQSLGPVMRVKDQSLHVSTSIGIAMFPNDGQDIYTLLKNADTALYRAKDSGRNRFQFYDYSMNLQSAAKLSLEQDLRDAVSEHQLEIMYQPFASMKTGKILGVEALVRWNHPKLGMLLPYDFIPLAEETGMIIPIGNWILKTVCEHGKQIHDEGFPLQFTVNLSARQFAETELIETINSILLETEFNPSSLEIEITESIAMENISRTSNKLQELKQKGVTIAIDDFGTGYSSLSYLKRFPVHKLKIDKSFLKHAITDPQDSTIIRAIISMGQSLNLKVCAEGVETDQQEALLASMKCDMIQGYLVSKPLPLPELVPWLKAR